MEFKHSLAPDPDHPTKYRLTIFLSDQESIVFYPLDEMASQEEIVKWVKRYEQEVKPDQSLLINVLTAGLRQK
jgi:hypothetical protein